MHVLCVQYRPRKEIKKTILVVLFLFIVQVFPLRLNEAALIPVMPPVLARLERGYDPERSMHLNVFVKRKPLTWSWNQSLVPAVGSSIHGDSYSLATIGGRTWMPCIFCLSSGFDFQCFLMQKIMSVVPRDLPRSLWDSRVHIRLTAYLPLTGE